MSYSIQQPDDGSFRIVENASGKTIFQSDSDGKTVSAKVATVARTDTTAKNLFTLPANAIPIGVYIVSPLVPNNVDTATVSVGKTGSNTYFVNAADVKTAAGQLPCAAAAHLGSSVGTSEIQVVGIYAETGTASSTGGPFTVVMSYYVA